VTHEYSTILLGIQESVPDILINLKKILLKSKSNSCEIQKAFLSIFGPKEVTARDIVLLEEQKDLVTQVLLQLLEMRLDNVIFAWLQMKKWKLVTF